MTTPHLHLGKYYRYLFADTNLLVIIGYFEEVLKSKALYEERHRIAPASGATADTLEKIMASAALAAVSLAERESWGFTITLPGTPVGYFCGVEPEGMICGTSRPADAEKNAAYVQRQKGEEPMTQSYYAPDTADPVTAVARYFSESAQVATRIVLGPGHVGVLVQALPGGRFDDVAGLTDDQLFGMVTQMANRGELKPVGEVVQFYECRCDEEMILDMMTKLPQATREEIWADQTGITAECPRCGREYRFEKQNVVS